MGIIKLSPLFWVVFDLRKHQTPHSICNTGDIISHQKSSYSRATMVRNVTEFLVNRRS